MASIFIHPVHLINNHPFFSKSAHDDAGFVGVELGEEWADKEKQAAAFMIDDSPNLGFHSVQSTK